MRRNKGKKKLAAIRASRNRSISTGRKLQEGVENPLAFRSTLRKGCHLYCLLTDKAERDVYGFGKPVVSSHLIPIPFKRRHLLRAAKFLEKEVANGMALALEVPIDMSTIGTYHNGETITDEHLNLVRDHPVNLHTKLVESEENKSHMSSYINFEEDAQGDDEILGEQDYDYFTDEIDASFAQEHSSGAESERSQNSKAPMLVSKPYTREEPINE
jgi:hypothetical protein